jgi:uncharacterized membrane protein YphA (DoxX/SURF4 family)
MALVLLLIRLVLALVFLVAGGAKLADLTGSQLALRNFGVPTRLATPLGLLLPLAELVVAIALLASAWARFGAIGALVLLLVFVAGISYNLARGRTPDCHCFGQLHSAPAGPSTLIRNLVLAAWGALSLVSDAPTPGLILWVGLARWRLEAVLNSSEQSSCWRRWWEKAGCSGMSCANKDGCCCAWRPPRLTSLRRDSHLWRVVHRWPDLLLAQRLPASAWHLCRERRASFHPC